MDGSAFIKETGTLRYHKDTTKHCSSTSRLADTRMESADVETSLVFHPIPLKKLFKGNRGTDKVFSYQCRRGRRRSQGIRWRSRLGSGGQDARAPFSKALSVPLSPVRDTRQTNFPSDPVGFTLFLTSESATLWMSLARLPAKANSGTLNV
jgi:hypothetical protein